MADGIPDWIIECNPLGDNPHQHVYPSDWEFGGADNSDPRADPRWEPTTYTYYGSDAQVLTVTQAPLCDDQALDEFTLLVYNIKDADPKWIWKKAPHEPLVALPWQYNAADDSLEPM